MTKPATNKPAPQKRKTKRSPARCHPWRVWTPKVEKKPGDVFVPTIPASSRMGLSL